MNAEALPVSTFEGITESSEYKTRLSSCVEDAKRFAQRIKAVAEEVPTEADVKQLKDELETLTESTLIAHDSISNDAVKDGSDLHVKGTNGDFMATIRIKFLEELGNGNYDSLTPARVLFEEKINPGMGAGFLSYRGR